MQKTAYSKGVLAETLAVWLLRAKGYRILARRHKTRMGEADLIARRGRTLVVVEVKERGDIATALEAVTPAMRRRIVRAGLHYWSSYPEYRDFTVRFDLVAIALPFSIVHLVNAWDGDT
ncbi:MAG: YraN family protein [Alphaproteobacteria bacterium]|nr:YraN family protein [Alphaproteobacteria bacterium]